MKPRHNALFMQKNGFWEAVSQGGDCATAQISLFTCWLQSLFDCAYNTTMSKTEGNTRKYSAVYHFEKIMNAATMLT